MKAGRCFLQTVGVLVLFTAARATGLLGAPRYVYVSDCLLTVALVLIAWSARATPADLGLARTDMRAGLGYGAGAFGIVLLVLMVAAMIPATSGFLHDSREEIGGWRMFYELAVSIVLTPDWVMRHGLQHLTIRLRPEGHACRALARVPVRA